MNKDVLKTTFGSTATIYPQGGHVASWVPSAELGEQLFVAKQAEFAEGKAIRGGVPVCFPQFAAFGPGVKHGFARTAQWQLDHASDDKTTATYVLNDNAHSQSLWPHAFKLALTVAMAPTKLTMTLAVTNISDAPFEFSGALHTYFAVSHYQKVVLSNLDGTTYWDNGTPLDDKKVFSSHELQLEGALDRVYFDAPDQLDLVDGALIKRITKSGFTDVVVWNPGPEGAKGLKDMGDEEYTGMLCVEAAIVDKPITLEPGQSWSGMQALEVLPIANSVKGEA